MFKKKKKVNSFSNKINRKKLQFKFRDLTKLYFNYLLIV